MIAESQQMGYMDLFFTVLYSQCNVLRCLSSWLLLREGLEDWLLLELKAEPRFVSPNLFCDMIYNHSSRNETRIATKVIAVTFDFLLYFALKSPPLYLWSLSLASDPTGNLIHRSLSKYTTQIKTLIFTTFNPWQSFPFLVTIAITTN